MTEPMDYRLVRSLQARVADLQLAERRSRQAEGLPDPSAADEQEYARSLIRTVVAEHLQEQLRAGVPIPEGDGYDTRLRTAIFAAIFGAGELQELLDNDLVENIDINGCEQTWVTFAGGERVAWRPLAASNEDLIGLLANLGAYAGVNARPFSPAAPQLDVRLADGSRLSAVMSATAVPVASIRRNRFPQMFLSPDLAPPAADNAQGGAGGATAPDLVSLGTISAQVAEFLYAAVVSRCNIVIAGATDSGKTSCLRALAHCVDPTERIITIEKALELGLGRYPRLHRDVVEMEEVLPDADGRFVGLDIAALVRRSRRMNPSRVLVGEVMGPEVADMLTAMSQGNDGGLTTLHTRDGAGVVEMLALYAGQHAGLTDTVAHRLIAHAIDFIVYIAKNPRCGMARTVTEIIEVAGVTEGHVAESRIFAPSPRDGRAERCHEIPIVRLPRLAQAAGYTDGLSDWTADDGALRPVAAGVRGGW